jgi:hypothetical protein
LIEKAANTYGIKREYNKEKRQDKNSAQVIEKEPPQVNPKWVPPGEVANVCWTEHGISVQEIANVAEGVIIGFTDGQTHPRKARKTSILSG